MRTCPKCSQVYGDDFKICRVCGGILEDDRRETARDEGGCGVQASTPAPAAPVAEGESGQALVETPWPTVEPVTAEKPQEPRGSSQTGAESGEPAPSPSRPRRKTSGTRQCTRCGSHRIVPGARVLDSNSPESGTTTLKVAVDGHPGAWLFKQTLYGKLTADICANCGHVALRVDDSRALYRRYLDSLQ